MITRRTWPGLTAALLGGLMAVGVAQQDFSRVEIRTERLADDVDPPRRVRQRML